MENLNVTVHVSGYVLGSLAFHHLNHDSDVEGFLLGEVKAEEKNSITDSQIDDVQVEYTIDIHKHIPCHKTQSFYNSVGEVNQKALKMIQSFDKQKVIGWYRQRRNTEQAMTFREHVVHRSLEKHLSNQELVFLLLTSNVFSGSNSTHVLGYAVYKPQGRLFQKIPVMVTNLGMADQHDYHTFSTTYTSQGYSCAIKKHRSKFFNPDGTLKEVCEINKMSSSLQEELKKTCKKVEESERSVEKLLSEVKHLRKIVKEKKKLAMQEAGAKDYENSKAEENILLCQALQKLFPESKLLQTRTTTVDGFALPAYCCGTDHDIDILERLTLVAPEGPYATRTPLSHKRKAVSPVHSPPPPKSQFKTVCEESNSEEDDDEHSNSETVDDLHECQNGVLRCSQSPTF
ncbi:BRCA1-A complex subunit Abraxas 1 isoform X1 [Erpetoichthys calabaricus]|uniref:BRCA1-A complex subunit Abraxas 1 n=1 Tax=Erpetoichthys calabaricus TaxID=27687 RepID=A0A8C4SC90_ERPCA|nr:BRCA1-A complex subunit Abraxas 1 isoform X1 [Erpetoichthys calabaricus]